MSPDSSSLSQSSPGSNPGKILQTKFEAFLHTLSDTLTDFTALEVNTMIVSGITGAKFNPLNAYETIYERGEQMQQLLTDAIQKNTQDLQALQQNQQQQPSNPPALDQIQALGQKISDYQKLLSNLNDRYGIPEETIDDPTKINSTKIPEKLWPRYVKLIDQLHSAYRQYKKDNSKNTLPDPNSDSDLLNAALDDVVFVRTLRKLSELRAALDGENINSTSVDLIYAQTIMQLDGDVINRYHEKLFDPSNVARRDIILSIHNQGVQEGERQWRGLMEFMVNLLTKFLPTPPK